MVINSDLKMEESRVIDLDSKSNTTQTFENM